MSAPLIIYCLVILAVVFAVVSLHRLGVELRSTRTSIKRRLALSVSADANSQLHDALRQERGLADLDNSRLSGLNDLLIQTGLSRPSREFALWTLLIGVAIAASMVGLVSRPVLAAAAGLLAAPLLVVMYLAIARRRRIARFTEQLPDALDVIVRSLRIGHPLAAAIRLVAGKMAAPIGAELRMTADEIAFGQDTVTAVSNLHRRVGQDDLTFLVIAVSVQSQTGREPCRVAGSTRDPDARPRRAAAQD